MSKKCCNGDGEGRKDKGGGGGKMVCDKIVCVKDGVCQRCDVKDGVWQSGVSKTMCERWRVTKWYDKDGAWKIVCDKVVC